VQYLDKANIAECMTICECAQWIAFGLLPAPDYVFDGQSRVCDRRQDVPSITAIGGSPDEPPRFLGIEFLRRILPAVDPFDYFDNLELSRGLRPADVKAESKLRQLQFDVLKKLTSNGGDDNEADWPLARDESEEVDAAKWMERNAAPLCRMEERAQSDVF
jgi:hypothetical protein